MNGRGGRLETITEGGEWKELGEYAKAVALGLGEFIKIHDGNFREKIENHSNPSKHT
jgi:hypothetical protein